MYSILGDGGKGLVQMGVNNDPEYSYYMQPLVSRSIYLIGSLRNPAIPEVAAALRAQGHYVFDDWFAAGPEADDWWKKYEQARGHSYLEALKGHAAQHVFSFDKQHLDEADTSILVLPAGKSCHLEAGYQRGAGKRLFILLDQPDRWDVMYRFAHGVFDSLEQLMEAL